MEKTVNVKKKQKYSGIVHKMGRQITNCKK